MTYKITEFNEVVRIADNLFLSPEMPEWAEYQTWLGLGNVPVKELPLYRLARVGVVRQTDGLHITRDMAEWKDYLAWSAKGHIVGPLPAIALPEMSLTEAKRRRIDALTKNALKRTAAVLPEFGNLSALILMKELYLSIAPAARQPTVKLQAVIDIYSAWNSAVGDVKACQNVQCVANVTANWP